MGIRWERLIGLQGAKSKVVIDAWLLIAENGAKHAIGADDAVRDQCRSCCCKNKRRVMTTLASSCWDSLAGSRLSC